MVSGGCAKRVIPRAPELAAPRKRSQTGPARWSPKGGRSHLERAGRPPSTSNGSPGVKDSWRAFVIFRKECRRLVRCDGAVSPAPTVRVEDRGKIRAEKGSYRSDAEGSSGPKAIYRYPPPRVFARTFVRWFREAPPSTKSTSSQPGGRQMKSILIPEGEDVRRAGAAQGASRGAKFGTPAYVYQLGGTLKVCAISKFRSKLSAKVAPTCGVFSVKRRISNFLALLGVSAKEGSGLIFVRGRIVSRVEKWGADPKKMFSPGR